MPLHANARLTVQQRQEVQRLHAADVSIRELASQFGVNPTTIQRWVKRDSPLDRTSAPVSRRTVITPEYRAAVIEYRKAHPKRGPEPIARELREKFPGANRGTALRILQEEGLTQPARRREQNRHRLQVDIKQLPVVEEGGGPQYGVTVTHLRTRLKHSEVCGNHRAKTVAAVLMRALDLLPPLFQSEPTPPASSQ